MSDSPFDRTISASVGRRGSNRHDDVVTVQKLLNRVPNDKGAPSPKLDVDGLVGPKTIGAIQRFQLHHFGFKGMDGRVDPSGQTIRKLNEFDPIETGRFAIRRVRVFGEREVFLDPNDNSLFFFQVTELSRRDLTPARYYLGRRSDLRRLRPPRQFFGINRPFTPPANRDVDELGGGRAIYDTIRFRNLRGGTAKTITFSHLNLFVRPVFMRIHMLEDLKLPPVPAVDTGSINFGVASNDRAGDFILVP